MIRTSNINKNYGKDIKIIVVGNSNSGKTSYVNKWINNSFIENYKATILSDFGSKIVEKNGTIYRVQIWDIAGNLRYKIGQDRSASLTKIFCKDCNGAICISDITAPYSLKDALNWKEAINEIINVYNIPIILVENKADLVPDFSRTNENFINFSQNNNFSGCFRTSAKSGLNINESLDFLLNQIIINMEQNLGVKGKVRSGSRLYDGTPNTKKKNCC